MNLYTITCTLMRSTAALYWGSGHSLLHCTTDGMHSFLLEYDIVIFN